MDLKQVEELIELMRQSGVMQMSLEVPNFKVSITRGPRGADAAATVAHEGEPSVGPAEESEEQVQPTVERESAISVVAPVVGVFHNGGMLDPRQLVREGDRVREGQLLAAIEAMKVPNELRAPASGLVARLLVEDGSAVEYGQTILVIDPEERGEMADAEPPIGLA